MTSFTVQDGISPLYAASQKGHTDVVDLLVRAGADVHLATTKVFAYIMCDYNQFALLYVHVFQSTSNYMSVHKFSDTIHDLIVYAMVPLFFVIMYVQALNVILYVHILVSASDFAIA